MANRPDLLSAILERVTWTIEPLNMVPRAVLATPASTDADKATDWLGSQWASLDHSRPLVPSYYPGSAEESRRQRDCLHADLHLIADIDSVYLWGEINNRPESYVHIMTGLTEGFLQKSYEQ